MTSSSRTNSLLLAAAALLALAYLLAGGASGGALPPIPLALLKAGGIIVLAIYAFRLDVPDKNLFAAALGFSALGDFLLNIGPFVSGLSAFLVAHLIYITVFVRAIRRNGPRPGRWRWPALGVLTLLMAAMPAWLWGDLGAMRAPVLFYSLSVGAMAASALLAPGRGYWLPLGGVIFVISDSLIGVNVFKADGGLPDLFFWPGIWITYVAAQFCLTLGFARMRHD